MSKTNETAARITYLCNMLPERMLSLSEEEFTQKPIPGKWSKKEILGHLVDSAANNHQRFIRTQFEEAPVIFYDQDEWVRIQDYQSEKKEMIITLWATYNRHLAYVISGIPDEKLTRSCKGRNGAEYTLEFLVTDYLTHLEHHLKQLIAYE